MPEQSQNPGASSNRSQGGSGGGNANRNRNRNRNKNRNGGSGSGSNRSGGGGRSSGGGGGGQNRSRQGGNSHQRSRSGASRAASVAVATEVLAPMPIEPGLGATEVLPDEIKANRRRAVWLCVLWALLPPLIVGIIVGAVVSALVGAVILVVLWAAGTYALWRVAPNQALKRIGAVPMGERDHPRLTNVTEGLCATFGLRMPDLYIVFDAVPNACALGRDTASSALVVTSGLLETMGPIELEGVIAHELAHVKRSDNTVSVIGLTLSRLGGERVLSWCVGPNREYRADVVSASAVRYPRGLLDALRLMEAAPAPVGNSLFGPARFGPVRHVWIDPCVGHRLDPGVLGDLDDTSVRVAALSEW